MRSRGKEMIKIFISLILLFCTNSFSNEVEALYSKGEYASVINHFKDTSKESLSSIELNMLGNAYYRLARIEEASLYYYLGLKITPRSPEFSHNLSLSNPKVFGSKGFYGTRLTEQEIFSFFVFFIAIFSIYYLFRPRLRRKTLGISVYALLFLGTLFFGVSSPNLGSYGVTKESVELKSGYDPDAMSFYEVPKGVIVKKFDQVGDFVKIKVVDEKETIGWTKRSFIFF